MTSQSEAGTATVDPILAGIVTFHPDMTELAGLVGSVAADVVELVIYCNSPLAERDEATLREVAPNLSVVRPGANLGLGEAYNAFVARADEIGARFLLLLDQDSLPSPGMIGRLARTSQSLEAAGERPAVVGPRPVDPFGIPMKIPVRAGAPVAGATRVSFVISSGSLLDVAIATAVGPFRADYFIDAIDIEWCLRAADAGYSIWVADTVPMDHRLGRGIIRLPLGIHLADQPARRLETYLRNQIDMLRLPHVPSAYKAKVMLTMPARLLVHLVHNRVSTDYLRAIARGLRDGWRGRLGPPGTR